MGLQIGIILFDGAEELDFVGPWEVFTAARLSMPDRFAPVLISETGAKVTCAKGMVVEAQKSFAEAPPLDVLLAPGGLGTRREVNNRAMLDYIAAASAHCTWRAKAGVSS